MCSQTSLFLTLKSEFYNINKLTTTTVYDDLHTDILTLRSLKFNPDTIELRLRELAYLNSAATIKFRALGKKRAIKAVESDSDPEDTDTQAASVSANGTAETVSPAPGDWKVFHYDGGIQEFVAWVNREKPVIHDPIYVSKKVRHILFVQRFFSLHALTKHQASVLNFFSLQALLVWNNSFRKSQSQSVTVGRWDWRLFMIAADASSNSGRNNMLRVTERCINNKCLLAVGGWSDCRASTAMVQCLLWINS